MERGRVSWIGCLWIPAYFTATAYLAARRTLYLRFRSGELYCYFEFPPQQYRAFLASDSKGQYFRPLRSVRAHLVAACAALQE
jgi:hypothetical protein